MAGEQLTGNEAIKLFFNDFFHMLIFLIILFFATYIAISALPKMKYLLIKLRYPRFSKFAKEFIKLESEYGLNISDYESSIHFAIEMEDIENEISLKQKQIADLDIEKQKIQKRKMERIENKKQMKIFVMKNRDALEEIQEKNPKLYKKWNQRINACVKGEDR